MTCSASGHCSAHMTCDHQVKKVLKSVKQNVFSRFYTSINIIT